MIRKSINMQHICFSDSYNCFEKLDMTVLPFIYKGVTNIILKETCNIYFSKSLTKIKISLLEEGIPDNFIFHFSAEMIVFFLRQSPQYKCYYHSIQ